MSTIKGTGHGGYGEPISSENWVLIVFAAVLLVACLLIAIFGGKQ